MGLPISQTIRVTALRFDARRSDCTLAGAIMVDVTFTYKGKSKKKVTGAEFRGPL
jgi:hypothetical protein